LGVEDEDGFWRGALRLSARVSCERERSEDCDGEN
jgi:hypothetical protein